MLPLSDCDLRRRIRSSDKAAIRQNRGDGNKFLSIAGAFRKYRPTGSRRTGRDVPQSRNKSKKRNFFEPVTEPEPGISDFYVEQEWEIAS